MAGGLFVAVWLVHWPLLHLPYYWDEAGYYIPAAYDFFRTGTLIPFSTLSNAHPPLPSLYLAACWRLFGFSPFVTRTAMCLLAALALGGVYRLGLRATRDPRASWALVAMTAAYPVWFVQSTLAHADLLAATGTLWGLVFLLEGTEQDASDRRSGIAALVRAAGCFALAALAKEIAIGTPLALAAWELVASLRERSGRLKVARSAQAGSANPGAVSPPAEEGHLQAALLLLTPGLPLAAWFAYHRERTGFAFGNPEYLRYNATATLTPVRILLALGHRALHLSAHLNLFVPVMVTFGCLLLPRLNERAALSRSMRNRLLVVIVANWVLFSMLGGALLTRYLLPLYPLVLLLCVDVWRQRLRRWEALAALTVAAFVLGLFVNPPYRFAPEDTLAYRDSILLEQDAIGQTKNRYGRPTVLTAWPASDGLTKPELGYVSSPVPVVAIDNFSYSQIQVAQQKAAQEARTPGSASESGAAYTVALLFSTKYEPAPLLDRIEGGWGARQRALDERYFGLHADLAPATVARLLGGEVEWQEQRHGQWAAVLHFDRPQLAAGRPVRSPVRPDQPEGVGARANFPSVIPPW